MKRIAKETNGVNVYPTGSIVVNRAAVANLQLKNFRYANVYRNRGKVLIELAQNPKDHLSHELDRSDSYICFTSRDLVRTLGIKKHAKQFHVNVSKEHGNNWLELHEYGAA